MPVSRRRVAFRLRPVTIRQAWIGSTELETRPPAATQQRTALHSTNDQRPLEESPVTCSRQYPVLSKRSSVSIQQSAFDDYSSSGGFSLPRATAPRSIPRRSILANNCLPAADSAASGIFEPDATLPAKRAAVATYGDAGSAQQIAAARHPRAGAQRGADDRILRHFFHRGGERFVPARRDRGDPSDPADDSPERYHDAPPVEANVIRCHSERMQLQRSVIRLRRPTASPPLLAAASRGAPSSCAPTPAALPPRARAPR